MSIAGKVIGYLGSVFGLYPRSGGGVAVRQSGGTAGADEIQISHDGTDGTIDSKDGYLKLSAGGVNRFRINSSVVETADFQPFDDLVRDIGTAAKQYKDFFIRRLVMDAANACVRFTDVSFYRLAAGVFGVGSGGASGVGWLQNSSGRSRVNSAVTNTGITPAAITGLSHTLIAGRKYTGRLVLYAAVPTSADGIRIDFDGGTATMTSFVAQGVLSDDTSTRKLARTTALATDITDTDLNGDGLITIELGFVCNAAGTFIPRVAKEADAAGATLTVLANSFLWLEDMP